MREKHIPLLVGKGITERIGDVVLGTIQTKSPKDALAVSEEMFSRGVRRSAGFRRLSNRLTQAK